MRTTLEELYVFSELEKIGDIRSKRNIFHMIADSTADYLKKMSTQNLKPSSKLMIIQNRMYLGACLKVSLVGVT